MQKMAIPEINHENGAVPNYRLVPPERYRDAATKVFGEYIEGLEDDFFIFEQDGDKCAESNSMKYSEFIQLYTSAEKEAQRQIEEQLADEDSEDLTLGEMERLKDNFKKAALDDQLRIYADSHGPLFGAAGLRTAEAEAYIVEPRSDWNLAFRHMVTAIKLQQCSIKPSLCSEDKLFLKNALSYDPDEEARRNPDRYACRFEADRFDVGGVGSLAMERLRGSQETLHEESEGNFYDVNWEKELVDDRLFAVTVELVRHTNTQCSRTPSSKSSTRKKAADERVFVRPDLFRLFRAIVKMNLLDVRVGFHQTMDLFEPCGMEFENALSCMWHEIVLDGQNNIFHECAYCGTYFVRTPKHRQVYCSQSCKVLYNRRRDRPILERTRKALLGDVGSYEEIFEKVYGRGLQDYDDDSKDKMQKLDAIIGGLLEKPKYRMNSNEGVYKADSPIHEKLQRKRALELLSGKKLNISCRDLFIATYKWNADNVHPLDADVAKLYVNLAVWIGEYQKQGNWPNNEILEKLKKECLAKAHMS